MINGPAPSYLVVVGDGGAMAAAVSRPPRWTNT